METIRAKRQGLRIAISVSVGLTIGLCIGNALPFLAPMFATQFLIADYRPPTLRQGIGMVLLILVTGAALLLCTNLLWERPWVLLPLLWLVYVSCYWKQHNGNGGGAPALILVVAVIVPLLDILQCDLGEAILLILIKAVVGGVMLAWVAHAVLPDPLADVVTEAPPLSESVNLRATRQALASASILLIIVTFCLVDPRMAIVLVLPLTVAALLGQLELDMAWRTVLGLILINLVGGIAASLAFALVELRPALWQVFLTVLLVSLLFAGRAILNVATAKIFAGGLVTFLILFGLGTAPLPASSSELFMIRIAYVLFAIMYALGMTLLFWPKSRVNDFV